jgi:hypothetical protein
MIKNNKFDMSKIGDIKIYLSNYGVEKFSALVNQKNVDFFYYIIYKATQLIPINHSNGLSAQENSFLKKRMRLNHHYSAETSTHHARTINAIPSAPPLSIPSTPASLTRVNSYSELRIKLEATLPKPNSFKVDTPLPSTAANIHDENVQPSSPASDNPPLALAITATTTANDATCLTSESDNLKNSLTEHSYVVDQTLLVTPKESLINSSTENADDVKKELENTPSTSPIFTDLTFFSKPNDPIPPRNTQDDINTAVSEVIRLTQEIKRLNKEMLNASNNGKSVALISISKQLAPLLEERKEWINKANLAVTVEPTEKSNNNLSHSK